MNRTAALLAVTVAAVGVAAPSALAAPKKTITKTYTASHPMPDPTNYAQQGYSVCAQNVPQSFHTETFKVPAAGTLQIDMSDFVGDADLLLMDAKKEEIANSGNGPEVPTEALSAKFKKAQTVQIVACNWSSGATSKIKYVFTYK